MEKSHIRPISIPFSGKWDGKSVWKMGWKTGFFPQLNRNGASTVVVTLLAPPVKAPISGAIFAIHVVCWITAHNLYKKFCTTIPVKYNKKTRIITTNKQQKTTTTAKSQDRGKYSKKISWDKNHNIEVVGWLPPEHIHQINNKSKSSFHFSQQRSNTRIRILFLCEFLQT